MIGLRGGVIFVDGEKNEDAGVYGAGYLAVNRDLRVFTRWRTMRKPNPPNPLRGVSGSPEAYGKKKLLTSPP